MASRTAASSSAAPSGGVSGGRSTAGRGSAGRAGTGRTAAGTSGSRAGGGRAGKAPLLPPAARDFIRQRAVEGVGLTLTSIGLLLVLVLLTYDRGDPSWNTAVNPEANPKIGNVLGLPGAYAADLLMQWLGMASYLLGAIVMAWGLRIMSHRGLSRIVLRGLMTIVGVLTASIFFAQVPAFPGWQLTHGHLGGTAGDVLLTALSRLTGGLIEGLDRPLLATISGGVSVVSVIVALGLSLRDWRDGARSVGWAVGAAGRGAREAGGMAGQAARDASGLLRNRPRPDGLSGVAALFGFGRPHEEDEAEAGAPPPRPRPARGVRKPPRLNDVEADDPETAGDPGEEDAEAAPKPPRPVSVVKPPSGPKPAAGKASGQREPMLELLPETDYELPPLDLLQEPDPSAKPSTLDDDALRQNAVMLEGVLGDFGVRGEIQKVHPGPVVTLYELEPAPGTKSSRVIGLADDIARSMSAVSVRVAVVPGRNVIGIELPNARREMVLLRELLAAESYERSAAKLALVLGKDIGGQPVIADLARFPHLLVAGTTGSGKSVAINTMILSLLYRLPPDKCRFIMIDPKMLELSIYEGIPHLLTPVVTDPKKAVVALKWTVREMESRYRSMSKLGVRNIEGYNARLREAKKNNEVLTRRVQTGFDPDTGKPIFEDQPIDLTELPYIVVVVDEMADLMLVAGKDIEAAIQRLAQMARAAGIHLIMATQRPSVDVITGTIKANFPTRISFQVTSKIDSRTILGEQGAEQLLGQGDMLYMAGGGRITRVHGPFVRDDEVEHVVSFLRSQGEPNYMESITEDEEELSGGGFDDDAGGRPGSGDELYDKAVALVLRERKCSTSFVQRHLQIGYNKAARLVERMEQEGVVSQANHVGKREVLGRSDEAEE
ncbi:DNA translocase FtsK 4TM domain-containing protein [Skermanella mucosa]|uniref:FtsK/SpoIIIE family DNA translocase n=1 Tax=Skermanella mucosa TaxID=1789672 RepID=UPI001E4986AD|nr:DNA translocase FtsK [Skermanella mucosa]UEM21447.1 DNA translocase FtsK 4TM domain-containing protein [Skermanella mucosa]